MPIERIIEFDFELDIVPVPGLMQKFDVDAFITSDLTEIRVDRYIQERRSNRYRFSLATELAHVFLHKEVFRELRFASITEWKRVIASIPEEAYGWIEYQAYCWGGLVLVPAKPLKDKFDDCVATAAAAGIKWDELSQKSRRPILDSIARTFDVSMEVVSKRMKYDKLGQSAPL